MNGGILTLVHETKKSTDCEKKLMNNEICEHGTTLVQAVLLRGVNVKEWGTTIKKLSKH